MAIMPIGTQVYITWADNVTEQVKIINIDKELECYEIQTKDGYTSLAFFSEVDIHSP
jgi:hypothetical protein